ncbi:MAG: hypothetical protein EOR86_13625 [Mesorhizobium sp.]|uniref:hypothetical protein n=1 Tax=Mesorhizobium sp. TaxID=1871066 RepID=UPI000FEA8BEE|nr:hypothetical protein [Mesorhizobium sp.]RWM96239.1 MAG: hypothetical protein EOR86_13625 [Mesorhizobium sp.]
MNRTVTVAVLLLAVISASAADAKVSLPTVTKVSLPTVTNDPLGALTAPTLTPGASDLVNNTPTSTIQEIRHPRGMAPLTVLSDPLGTSIQPAFPGPLTTPATTPSP